MTFVLPDSDNFSLQTSLLITHDNTPYRIFISTDKLECFMCKQPGHTVEACTNPPSNSIQNPSLQTNDSLPMSSPVIASEIPTPIDDQTNTKSTALGQLPNLDCSTHGQKRVLFSASNTETPPQLSPSSTPTENQMPPPSFTLSQNIPKHTLKKPKTSPKEDSKLTTSINTALHDLFKNKRF